MRCLAPRRSPLQAPRKACERPSCDQRAQDSYSERQPVHPFSCMCFQAIRAASALSPSTSRGVPSHSRGPREATFASSCASQRSFLSLIVFLSRTVKVETIGHSYRAGQNIGTPEAPDFSSLFLSYLVRRRRRSGYIKHHDIWDEVRRGNLWNTCQRTGFFVWRN